MLQAVLNEVNDLTGVRIETVTMYDAGVQVAGLVIYGCHWEDGRLAINA